MRKYVHLLFSLFLGLSLAACSNMPMGNTTTAPVCQCTTCTKHHCSSHHKCMKGHHCKCKKHHNQSGEG